MIGAGYMSENPPAFPTATHHDMAVVQEDMSLRDWFAGQALSALLAGEDARRLNDRIARSSGIPTIRFVTGLAYEYADVMLAARAKGGQS